MKYENLPQWYKEKEFTNEERYAIETYREEIIIKETEKAQQLVWITKFGEIKKWVPKSIINNTYQRKTFDNVMKAITKDGREIEITKKGNLISYATNGKKYATETLRFI